MPLPLALFLCSLFALLALAILFDAEVSVRRILGGLSVSLPMLGTCLFLFV